MTHRPFFKFQWIPLIPSASHSQKNLCFTVGLRFRGTRTIDMPFVPSPSPAGQRRPQNVCILVGFSFLKSTQWRHFKILNNACNHPTLDRVSWWEIQKNSYKNFVSNNSSSIFVILPCFASYLGSINFLESFWCVFSNGNVPNDPNHKFPRVHVIIKHSIHVSWWEIQTQTSQID
jgi:hypothetical protein